MLDEYYKALCWYYWQYEKPIGRLVKRELPIRMFGYDHMVMWYEYYEYVDG